MPVPPSRYRLAQIAAAYELELSDDELTQLTELAAGSVAGYARLDELADEQLPVRHPRADTGHRPLGDENPSNGWIWRCSIPGASDGPLAGLRVGIKDNVCVAGVPLLNGSAVMEGYVPRQDATIVTRLLDAGAQIVGKTAVPAFCFDGGGCTGYPEPQPVNPHDPSRMCGASSNGSAVVVVTGEADVAIGGDQGGSIRLPASWSGCCGHKPTHGLVPYTGVFPIELTLDHVGPLARSVADCARVLDVVAGPDGLDPRQLDVEVQDYAGALEGEREGLRVGVLREGFGLEASEPDVDQAVRDAAEALAAAGAEVDEVSVPMHADGLAIWSAIATEGAAELMVRGNAFGTNWKGHYATDLLDFYARARRARADDYSVTVKLTLLVGHYMADRYNHHYYAKAQNLSLRLRAAYDEALERFDVLVMPTTPMKAQPFPGPDAGPADVVAAALGNLQNTAAFDATGHPALSVPCGFSGGLPIGLMLVGRRYDDATVLRAGHVYEQQRGEIAP